MAEWSDYSYAAHNGVFLKVLTKRHIFQFTKYEHNGITENISSDDRNFSSLKPQQNFQFVIHRNILFLECSK